MRAESRALLLEAVPPLREARTCLYTNAPDGHFLIDRHPGHPQVWIVSACSGHGFKSASAIGEVLADLTLGRESGFDLTPFAFERLRRLPLA